MRAFFKYVESNNIFYGSCMKLEIYEDAALPIIKISGHFSFIDGSMFVKSVEHIITGPANQIIIDLKNVDLIDTSALGGLLLLYSKCSDYGKSVILLGSSKKVLNMITASRLDKLFLIRDAQI